MPYPEKNPIARLSAVATTTCALARPDEKCASIPPGAAGIGNVAWYCVQGARRAGPCSRQPLHVVLPSLHAAAGNWGGGTTGYGSGILRDATKMLRCAGQDYAAAVTYGLGALGTTEPRTAHSFLPELEAELAEKGRLPVDEFAKRLGEFFLGRFHAAGMIAVPGNDMCFLVGGYNSGEPYGRIYQVVVPSQPTPVELNAGIFGLAWGGQLKLSNRLIVWLR